MQLRIGLVFACLAVNLGLLFWGTASKRLRSRTAHVESVSELSFPLAHHLRPAKNSKTVVKSGACSCVKAAVSR